ncbi:MAG TPA: aldo/keto reductase [Gammaproteobacteria bacterium]|nr:aldo/keto reductase [Gammaproteobacteria bacterium]
MNRRHFLLGLVALAALRPGYSAPASLLERTIPSSGERLPVIGMGTWITFNVNRDPVSMAPLLPVLRTFFEWGGALIDSSPMYGTAEAVLGELLEQVHERDQLFSATKVWTPGQGMGKRQMERSRELWRLPRFDLMQVHNLLDWEAHLETLQAWKAEGRIRYIGITTSHGRRHQDMEQIMERMPLDFVQFTYNVLDREAERRLFPLARERGLAVIINRPFRGGSLFDRVRNRPLPGWAAEIDCRNWAQVFLKFIVSHPTVTCAIPATSKVEHMRQNMGAVTGRLPDATLRKRMGAELAEL